MTPAVILVVGMCGDGKTSYSETLGYPVLHFDDIYDYGSGMIDVTACSAWVAEQGGRSIVLDGWHLGTDPNLDIARAVFGNDVEVHFVYSTPMERYLAQRTKEDEGCFVLPKEYDTFLDHAAFWGRHAADYASSIAALGLPIRWIFRPDGNTFREQPEANHLIAMCKADPIDEVLAWIDARVADHCYQTIELCGRVIRTGYTDSAESWRRLNDLSRIHWQGLAVADMGCYLGYFCFKAEQAGAQVIGYDKSPEALSIANRIALLNRSSCRFKLADLGRSQSMPEHFDVCLLLNMLHHVKRGAGQSGVDTFLDNVARSTNQVIVECELPEVPLICARMAPFALRAQCDSHRVTQAGTRQILHLIR